MIISVRVTYQSKVVVKWTIVEADEGNIGLTFSQIFADLKAGHIDGVEPWPWLNVNICERVEPFDVSIDKVSVGKTPENLMACNPMLVANKTCSTFGNFVQFSIKIEHPEDCICLSNASQRNVVINNAFEMMMQAARKAQSREQNNLPDQVEPKNQMDKLNNAIIELLKSKNLGWDSTRHFSFVSKLAKILWYIDGHHMTLQSRTKKIPELFSAFSGYNRPELNKHRKRTIDNLKSDILKSHVCTLQGFLGSTWMDQPAWREIKVFVLLLQWKC